MDSNNLFNTLRSIFEKYETNLSLLHNTNDNYYLNTAAKDNSKTDFFGAIQSKKSYISVHLMPIYYHPELLDNISEDLKKKMQGKSCFNFKDIDDKLLSELKLLTAVCFDKYISLNKI